MGRWLATARWLIIDMRILGSPLTPAPNGRFCHISEVPPVLSDVRFREGVTRKTFAQAEFLSVCSVSDVADFTNALPPRAISRLPMHLPASIVPCDHYGGGS